MNKITRKKDLMVPEVTTGAIAGSAKVYDAPEGMADVRVPFREIALTEAAGEPPFRVYDSSGPYTDANFTISISKSMSRRACRAIARRGSASAAASSSMTGARSSRKTTAMSRASIWRAISRRRRGRSAASATRR